MINNFFHLGDNNPWKVFLERMMKMKNESHIDMEKLNKVPPEHPFEYKDVVDESFPTEFHTEDGKTFKAEVENGIYKNVKVDKDTGSHILYRKL